MLLWSLQKSGLRFEQVTYFCGVFRSRDYVLSRLRASVESSEVWKKQNTAELQLSGLIGKTRRPDTQKIRIIGLFFGNTVSYIDSVKWKRKSSKGCFKLHIYLRKNEILIYNFFYLFDKLGEKFKP